MTEESDAPKVIKVKRNHIMAAKLMIERYERGVGPKPSPVVIAIANAKRKAAAGSADADRPVEGSSEAV
jgi:hypothetical protein